MVQLLFPRFRPMATPLVRKHFARIAFAAALSLVLGEAGIGLRAELLNVDRSALQRDYPNLAYNPGMESPDWFNPNHVGLWQDRPNCRRDGETFRSGQAAMRVAGPGAGYTFQQGQAALRPDTTYVLSAWIKTQNVAGRGVSLGWLPATPGSTTPAVSGSQDWTRVETQFKTSPQAGAGQLRIQWDLNEGDVAWVDDVRLAPADGRVAEAPPPTIETESIVGAGGLLIRLQTELPGAEIRYTSDGSEPDLWSTLYRGPFVNLDSYTLRARVFHYGHRESPVAERRLHVPAVYGPGVPLWPIDWSQEVDVWWERHIHNPARDKEAQLRRSQVRHPGPRINVAEVRDRHPQSTTAGIAEALAELPETGGTLWFPKEGSPYIVTEPEQKALSYYFTQGAMLISRRGNLHFDSDGAVIRCSWPVFGFCSMEYADSRTFNQPVRNLLFRGLTFDGQGQSDIAVNFIHCADVLFDDCRFENFVARRKPLAGQVAPPQSWSGHPAPIVATAKTDNIWIRNCRFDGGMWGVYWDGVHNGGIVGCRFAGQQSGPILIMTNNDMAPFSASQRNGHYNVIANCDFEGGRAAATLSNANTLVIGNRVRNCGALVDMQGRGRSNVYPGVAYEFYGNRLFDNRLENVPVLASWNQPCAAGPERPMTQIARNQAQGLQAILTTDRARPQPVDRIEVFENDLAGDELPQIRIRRDAAELIRDLTIFDNRLAGKPRPILVDWENQPLQAPGVSVRENVIREP